MVSWSSPGALGRVTGGPERGSLEVFRGCMGSPGTVLRGLVRVMCARRGFMGSPKLEILAFLQKIDVCVSVSMCQRSTKIDRGHVQTTGGKQVPHARRSREVSGYIAGFMDNIVYTLNCIYLLAYLNFMFEF